MTIKDLASKYRLRTRYEAEETIVPGKHGDIYEYSDEELGCMLMTSAKLPPRTVFWNKMSKEMQSKGMTLRQDGDAEGSFSFTGDNPEHVKLAMKLAGVRPKRKITESQMAVLKRNAYVSR